MEGEVTMNDDLFVLVGVTKFFYQLLLKVLVAVLEF